MGSVWGVGEGIGRLGFGGTEVEFGGGLLVVVE